MTENLTFAYRVKDAILLIKRDFEHVDMIFMAQKHAETIRGLELHSTFTIRIVFWPKTQFLQIFLQNDFTLWFFLGKTKKLLFFYIFEFLKAFMNEF